MNVREKGKETIKELVKKYKDNYLDYTNSFIIYNEAQLRIDFLDQFLEALGWDVLNVKQVPQYLREVVYEDTVKVKDNGEIFKKKPDYAFRMGQNRKFFLEAKKPIVPIISDPKPAFQLRRYGWNAEMPISILSNFDHLIMYDCRRKPDPNDDTSVCRMNTYTYLEYEDKFDEIYDLLSREAVYSGTFDETFVLDRSDIGTEQFDQYFLNQVERWRNNLAEDLFQRNPTLEQEQLNLLVQRLINRIIFLRVCEDREIETYEGLKGVKTYTELKKIFTKADKKYNSGLFNFIDDKISMKIMLGENILINIFKELYYPESPYAFSVVETEVISHIYELFLSKEIILNKGGLIEIVDKPEIIASDGVVPTPKYIVDEIVQRTLEPLCKDKTPDELSSLRIADIACGSGTFLLSAFEYLMNYHLEWYINDDVEKHRQKVYEGSKDSWFLELHEKRRILLNNIYGVDIDQQAVEVTQFSLLLKLLEDDTISAVESLLARYGLKALPDLGNNIRCGNSLVDEAYFRVNQTSNISSAIVKPLDWYKTFSEIMENGGFDAIIGNPPYIRIQNMVKYSPDEVRYYKSDKSPYVCAKQNSFDKYILFIERGLYLLKSTGRLGYIVPHKFFYLKSGSDIRQLISSKEYLFEIVHFGAQQVFKDQTTTYTCILILDKKTSKFVSVEHVKDINSWIQNRQRKTERIASSTFSEKPWILVPSEVRRIFEHLSKQNPIILGNVSKIFVGVQTSLNKIFIFQPLNETEDYVTFKDPDDRPWTIEKAILRPCIYKVKMPAFSRPSSNAYIIFPYKIAREMQYEQVPFNFPEQEYFLETATRKRKKPKVAIYSPKEIENQFPNAWDYLMAHKEQLINRKSVHGFTEDRWYIYGRNQSLREFDGSPKLIWSTLSLSARYAYDDANSIFTGGGNGPYYALKQISNLPPSLFYFLAILSHPLFDAMIKVRASQFRGNYLSYGKQFIKNVPVRRIDFTNSYEVAIYNKIVMLVQELIDTTQNKLQATSAEEKVNLETQAQDLKNELDSLVNLLYGISVADVELVKDLEKVGETLEADSDDTMDFEND